MKAVGIKVLKNRLSEFVHLAASGETVLVTDRERVVAELVPPQSHRAPTVHGNLWAEAIRQGHITPPLRPGMPLVPPPPAVATMKEMLAELEKDREDR